MSTQSRLIEVLIGLKGFHVLETDDTVDTSDNESGFYKIYGHQGNARFDAITDVGDSLANIHVHEGAEIYGHFTSVTCSNGTFLLYKL